MEVEGERERDSTSLSIFFPFFSLPRLSYQKLLSSFSTTSRWKENRGVSLLPQKQLPLDFLFLPKISSCKMVIVPPRRLKRMGRNKKARKREDPLSHWKNVSFCHRNSNCPLFCPATVSIEEWRCKVHKSPKWTLKASINQAFLVHLPQAIT